MKNFKQLTLLAICGLNFTNVLAATEISNFQDQANRFNPQHAMVRGYYMETTASHDRLAHLAGAIYLSQNLRPSMNEDEAKKVAAQAVVLTNRANSILTAARDPKQADLSEAWEQQKADIKSLNDLIPHIGSSLNDQANLTFQAQDAVLREAEQQKSVGKAADALQEIFLNSGSSLDHLSELREASPVLAKQIDAFTYSQNQMSLGESLSDLCARDSIPCIDMKVTSIQANLSLHDISEAQTADLIATALQHNLDISGKILKAQKENQAAILKGLAEANDGQKALPGKINEVLEAREKIKAANEREAQIQNIGVNLGIEIAGSLWGRKNPAQGAAIVEFGHQIVQAKAALELAKSFMDDKATSQAAGHGNASFFEQLSVGGLLTTNLVNLGFKLFNIFAHRNPPPTIEEVILKELRSFHQEFSEFAEQNQESLEEIDNRLVDVYKGLSDSLDHLANGQYQQQKSLDGLEGAVGNIQLGILRNEQNLADALRAQTFRGLDKLASDCLKGDDTDVSDRLSQQDFTNCTQELNLTIEKYSQDRMSQLQTAIDQDGHLAKDQFLNLLRQPLDISMSAVLRAVPAFYQSGSTADFLNLGLANSQIPSLKIWSAASQIETQLFSENLHYLDPSKDPLNRIRAPVAEFESIRQQVQSAPRRQAFLEALLQKIEHSNDAVQGTMHDEAQTEIQQNGVNVFSDQATLTAAQFDFKTLKVCGKNPTDYKASWGRGERNILQALDPNLVATPINALQALPPEALELAKLGKRQATLCLDSIEWGKDGKTVERYSFSHGFTRQTIVTNPYSGLPYTTEGGPDGRGVPSNVTSRDIYVQIISSRRLVVTLKLMLDGKEVTRLQYLTHDFYPVTEEIQKATADYSDHRIEGRAAQSVTRRTAKRDVLIKKWSMNGFGDAPVVTQTPIDNLAELAQTKNALRAQFYADAKRRDSSQVGDLHSSLQDLELSIESAKVLLTTFFPVSTLEDPLVRSELYGSQGLMFVFKKSLHDRLLTESVNQSSTTFQELNDHIAAFKSAVLNSPYFGKRSQDAFEDFPIIEAVSQKIDALQVTLAKRNTIPLDQASEMLTQDVLSLRD